MRSSNPSAAYRPKLKFMIVGAQKCGTTALREYLRQHPQIYMPADESHLFDGPTFSPAWSPQQIDERYAPMFRHCSAAVCGESTPIYMFLPEVAAAQRRYNPDLKLVVLLRDRVERAISQYYMNKNRGKERAPLWLALLAEPLRMRRCAKPREVGSNLRLFSYRRRGLYSVQMRNLYNNFPRSQVCTIHSQDLLHDRQAVLRRLFAFLGVAEDIDIPPSAVSSRGDYVRGRHRVTSWLLRISYGRERMRFKALENSWKHRW